MSWITIKLLGIRKIQDDGTPLPQRGTLNLLGATIEDDEANSATKITFVGVGTILGVSGQAPIVVTNNPDPAHRKVAITNATTGAAGAMSAADKAKLDGMGPGAAVVDVSGEGPIAVVTTGGHAVVSWGTPTDDLGMGGFGFTSCTGLASAAAVAITAAAGDITLNASTGVCRHKNGGNLVCTSTYNHAGATSHAHVAGVTAISESWAQDGSAAGGKWTRSGQRGFAGFAGGSLRFDVGDGGTLGTNLPGDVEIGLGTPVGGTTGQVRLFTTAGDVIGRFGLDALYYLFENGAAASNGIYVKSSSYVQIEGVAAAALTSLASDVWLRPGSGVVGIYVGSAYAAALTCDPTAAESLAMLIEAGTGGNDGHNFTVTAQPGQAATGGADNSDGGDLVLGSGPKGTGGGGAAGVDGDTILQTGSTPRVTCKGDGTALTLDSALVETAIFRTPSYNGGDSTGAVTLDFSQSLIIEVNALVDNVTFTITGAVRGAKYHVIVRQHASSAKTTTWPATVEFASGDDAIGTTVDTRTAWFFDVLDDGKITCVHVKKSIAIP